jgi:hypothetical protein
VIPSCVGAMDLLGDDAGMPLSIKAPQAVKGKGAGRGNVVLPPGAEPACDAQYFGEPHGSPK